MARIDLTSLDPVLKKLYSTEKVENLCYQDKVFLAMVKKEKDFAGKTFSVAVQYAMGQGASATFATAQANKGAAAYKEFVITRAKDYFDGSLDSDAIDAAIGDKYSMLNAVKDSFDQGFEVLSQRLARALWGTGSGALGQVLAGSTSTSFTLKNRYDVTKFSVGQEIVFSTANGGGSVKSGSVTVTAVNRSTGVITCDALTAIASTAGAATNDFIFVEGDYDLAVKGIRAWVPDSDPDSTAFFGVDRTPELTMLAGIRYDGSAYSIEEAIVNASAEAFIHGANPKTCFLHPVNYANLEKSLMGRVMYINQNVANILFSGIKINGQNGPIEVFSDSNCPIDRAMLLDMNTWFFKALGDVPHILNHDGLKMLRESAADAYEFRIGYKGNLICKAPGKNVNIKLS